MRHVPIPVDFLQFMYFYRTISVMPRILFKYTSNWMLSCVRKYCSSINSPFTQKKLYGPFLWMGFNCLKARATSRRHFAFYRYAPRNSWYSFYQPQKDERLSRPWSHPVALNMGPLDWKSSTLTTRPLLRLITTGRNIHRTIAPLLCWFGA